MARTVVVQTWCDECLADDKQVTATHSDKVGIVLGEGHRRPAWHELDLCDTHWQKLLAPVLDRLQEAPQVDPPGAGGVVDHGRVHCDWPDCRDGKPPGRGFRNVGSFAAHVRETHGVTQKQYRAKVGSEDRE